MKNGMNTKLVAIAAALASLWLVGCGEPGLSDKDLLERGKAGREVGTKPGAQPPPGVPTGPRPEGR